MNDFDDERLRIELDRRAGRGVSVAAAHDAVLLRAERVRRRRVAVAGSGALIALVVGGLVLLPGVDRDSRAPAGTGQPIPSVEDDDGLTSTPAPDLHRSRDDDGDDGGMPPPPADSTESSVRASTTIAAVAATTSNTATAASSTIPTSAAATTTAPSAGSSATTTVAESGPSSSSSIPTVAPFSRSYQSIGGSITVDWDGTSFSLLSVASAAGFEAEVEDQRATRIRVRFRGDEDDSRIEIRVENGQLTVDIS